MMRLVKKLFGVLCLVCLVLASFSSVAFAKLILPESPNEDRYVFDYAGILSVASEGNIEMKLASLEEETSSEISVVTVDSLQGYAIEDFSIELARSWGIGQEEHDNGLLLLVAPNERELRIEVGYGLEGAVTDAQSSLIINNVIIPHFKGGDFDAGVLAGVDALDKLARGEEFEFVKKSDFNGARFIPPELVFYGLIWLFAFFSMSTSWWAGGFVGGAAGLIFYSWIGLGVGVFLGLLMDFIASKFFYQKFKRGKGKRGKNYWGGGFGGFGGGSSGGSGGGFGGGSFGGGGSSGRW